MKIWKQSLITTLLFFTFISAVLYSACEKDACTNVNCFNGGSCNAGVCRCPLGYENTQCQTLSVTRYLGTYGKSGYTTCNNGAETIDTAKIWADGRGKNTVSIKLNSIYPKILQGYVNSNESTYAVIITNNDSSLTGQNIYTVTLQSDNSLSIHIYDYSITQTTSGPDTMRTQCTFLGVRSSL